jgi:uncharacterized C2H2 Zn-finger protein
LSHLQRHERTHADLVQVGEEEKVICPLCGNAYQNSSSLNRHMRKQHAQQTVDVQEAEPSTNVPGRTQRTPVKNESVQCRECNSMFYSQISLERHLRDVKYHRPRVTNNNNKKKMKQDEEQVEEEEQ